MAASEHYDDASLFEIIINYGFWRDQVGRRESRHDNAVSVASAIHAAQHAYGAIAERCRELRPVDIQILDGGIQLIADLDTSSCEDEKRWEESAGKGLVVVTGRL